MLKTTTMYVEAKYQRDGVRFIVFGVATSEALDSYGTIFSMEATRKAVKEYEQWRNLRASHDNKAIGTVPIIELTDDKMYIGAEIVDAEEIEKWEKGVYKGFSIAVNPIQEEYATRNGYPITVITDYQLVEISCVDRPSNPEAVATIMMRSDYNLAGKDEGWTWDWKTDADRIIEKLGWDGMKQACLYWDSDKGETKEAFKLPVAKLKNADDNKLTLYFYGVVAAMGALNGARGGVDISQGNREKIYTKIKELYALFDETPPELKKMEVRQMDEKQIQQEVEKGIVGFFKRLFGEKESQQKPKKDEKPAEKERIQVGANIVEQAKAVRSALQDKADQATIEALDNVLSKIEPIPEQPKVDEVIKALETRIAKMEEINNKLQTALNQALEQRHSKNNVNNSKQAQSPYKGAFVPYETE